MVPGMMPIAVPMRNVRNGTPSSAGTRFTSQNGTTGTSRRVSK